MIQEVIGKTQGNEKQDKGIREIINNITNDFYKAFHHKSPASSPKPRSQELFLRKN
jgi:hypothetical protein